MDELVATAPAETGQRRRRKSRHSAAKRRKMYLRWTLYIAIHIVAIVVLIYLWYLLTDHDPAPALMLL
jgi:polyferredoxin